jgi:Rhodopirellula transposase DDE domain
VNKVEHRLFSHITLNWRGRPLTSHEVVVKTIAATRTSGGLRVEAALDTGEDPTGVAISRQRLDALPLERHAVHGAWNYTLQPQPASRSTEAAQIGELEPGSPAQRRQAMLQQLPRPAADRHDQHANWNV